MLIDILAAAANAAPQNKFGFKEALEQGGIIAQSTVTIMAIFSFGSFFVLFTRWSDQAKIFKQYKNLGAFWKAGSLKEGAAKLDKQSPFRDIVEAGILAEENHGKMADSLEAHDWVHGSLARTEASIGAFLARGLPFLATVGSTAPFVGLFGTVVGIYRALIAIGLAGSASIDKVAGPVGEALIMTAIGLLVAVPAVLAYNFLQSRNKRINELLNGFSSDVLAYINSKGAIKPALPAAPVKAAPAPAAKK
ncbi:MotA/TolQ/ExbB proton channel family protein [Novosphingobium umbonatum]|uniref:Biopolymer transport protein ExbB n=1 Tax=Novosphingobium umbonatum TaxID=1908524 RepID=A0A3S2UQY8_9SPHN|nr:MotA/TolQ/ExbB proton channel family protein [Novosphingobium umbonatum]RVU04703.1 MotA/TolQ/ExbB proton channel family protein [Novosphingobium umbonatum]